MIHVSSRGLSDPFALQLSSKFDSFPTESSPDPPLGARILLPAERTSVGEKYRSDTPFVLRVRKPWYTEEKHAWLLYQYKVNVMKLVLMVHQFGTPGEERGRLPVMNVLFGHYCTQQQIPASHTGPPYWPPPRRRSHCGGHMVSAEHQRKATASATPWQWNLQSVSGRLAKTVTDQNQAFSREQCVLVEYVQRHIGGPSLLTLLLRLTVRAFLDIVLAKYHPVSSLTLWKLTCFNHIRVNKQHYILITDIRLSWSNKLWTSYHSAKKYSELEVSFHSKASNWKLHQRSAMYCTL